MQASLISAGAALLGALIGGLISFLLQRQKFRHDLEMLKQQYKTDFMAESTAKHFLSHKGYTDRSFETLKNHLGGFQDDELRKILVRAGAVRTFRKEDNSEWWRLLSRMDEYIEGKKSKKNAR